MFSVSSYPQSILRKGRRREIMRSIKVSDHMVERPVTISARSVVAEAAKVIVENKVSGLIVVDEESSVIGMLSELDCLRSL